MLNLVEANIYSLLFRPLKGTAMNCVVGLTHLDVATLVAPLFAMRKGAEGEYGKIAIYSKNKPAATLSA